MDLLHRQALFRPRKETHDPSEDQVKLREAISWSILVLAFVCVSGFDCTINGRQWSFHPVRKDGCSLAPRPSEARSGK